MPQIHISNLCKTFYISKHSRGMRGSLMGLFKREKTPVKALDSVSFSIDQGELVGYIGPNGAGKSTTVKILSGILVPDSGTCVVNSLVPWKQRIRHVRNIGVVFGQRTQLWWDLPVIESYNLLKDMYRIEQQNYKSKLDQLIHLVKIQKLLDTPVRQLSLGQRMRCDLVASLLHSPDILFLDEPTIGLDAPSKIEVRKFIKKLNKEHKTTVILTTHDMDDIEALCSRIMIISEGKIIFSGSLSDLKKSLKPERRLIIDFQQEMDSVDFNDIENIHKQDNRYIITYNPDKVSSGKLVKSIMDKYPVHDLFIESQPIEEVIADLYAGKI